MTCASLSLSFRRGHGLVATLWLCSLTLGQAAPPGQQLGLAARQWSLRYEQPAEAWNQALPVGNGRLGAMVFGGTSLERLQLNEETIWAGSPVPRDRKGAASHLPKIRELLFAGEAEAAEKLCQAELMSERLIRSYQTLGDLQVELEGLGEVSNYVRELDLRSGIQRTVFRTEEGRRIRREVFASAVDQVLVVELTCAGPGLTGQVRLSRPEHGDVRAEGSDQLILSGRADEGEATAGVRFEARLLGQADEEAKLWAEADRLRFEEVTTLRLLLAAGSDYRGPQELQRSEGELRQASGYPTADLRRRHALEHRELFARCDLDLGGWEHSRKPTDRRLRLVSQAEPDPQLIALLFHYGRYLLMGSSRPGSLPANLQGLWNEHIDAPWNSDYHININLQMNYWPAEVTGLADCHQPFLDFVARLPERGALTAAELYGARGWVAHHTTDAWAFTSPIGSTQWGLWPTGGAWCTRHYLEQWRYGGSREALAAAWPVLAGSARFFLDYLTPHPESGELLSGPSMSPENAYRTEAGQVAHVVMGPAMDQSIIRELFQNTLEAAQVLGRDDELIAEVQAALPRLGGLEMGADGRLLEWDRPYEEVEPGHRHMSHLYGLFPAEEIDLHATPELAAAARKSLEVRLANGGGHTGWSRAWMQCFWARLGEGDRAHADLLQQLSHSTLPNLLCDHPPFQIDGNFGATAAVAEMLLQSHRDELRFLPALPSSWSDGEVYDLRARGGHGIDIRWRGGRLQRARIRVGRNGPLRLRTSDDLRILSNGDPVVFERSEGLIRFQVQEGQMVELIRR